MHPARSDAAPGTDCVHDGRPTRLRQRRTAYSDFGGTRVASTAVAFDDGPLVTPATISRSDPWQANCLRLSATLRDSLRRTLSAP